MNTRYTHFSQRFFVSFYNHILPLVLVLTCVLTVWLSGLLLEPLTFDALLRLSAPKNVENAEPEKSPIELVILDDTSITVLSQRFGPFPWGIEVYAKLVGRLKEANPLLVVVTEPVNTPARPVNLFTKPLGLTKKVPSTPLANMPATQAVLATEGVYGLQLRRSQLLQVPGLQWYGLNMGILNLDSLQEDGLIRSVKPFWTTLDSNGASGLYPSLGVSASLEALNQLAVKQKQAGWLLLPDATPLEEKGHLAFQTESLKPKTLKVPLDAQKRLLLRWYKPLGVAANEAVYTHPATLLQDFFPELQPVASSGLKVNFNQHSVLFQQSKLAQRLKGKILVLGSAASAYNTVYRTPVANQHLAADVHATVIHNILSESLFSRASGWQRSLVLMVCFFILFWIRLRTKHFTLSTLYALACMAIYFWFVAWQLVYYRTVYDVVTPGLFMLMGYFFGMLRLSTARNAEMVTLTHNMAQLVSPSVFREVLKQKTGLEPGGERLELTVMMVDIRGFTSLAENLPASEVTELLNSFYGVVERIVFEHQGTIDKYLGDGVMILFGAPLQTERHAKQALLASLAMLDAIDTLAEQWWRQRHLFFHVGISVNTGFAFVGFVGPPQKLEYTALGDTVNLAARLQEQNKTLGEQLVFSEQTLNALPEDDELIAKAKPLGSYRVRGRTTMVALYTLPRIGSSA